MISQGPETPDMTPAITPNETPARTPNQTPDTPLPTPIPSTPVRTPVATPDETPHKTPEITPAIDSAIKWIDELTFAFFPYDYAFFANEAVSSIEQITSGMSYDEQVQIVCACISCSYLPDPINIMEQLLELITKTTFPSSMRDRCNIFVSACQMFLSFESK